VIAVHDIQVLAATFEPTSPIQVTNHSTLLVASACIALRLCKISVSTCTVRTARSTWSIDSIWRASITTHTVAASEVMPCTLLLRGSSLKLQQCPCTDTAVLCSLLDLYVRTDSSELPTSHACACAATLPPVFNTLCYESYRSEHCNITTLVLGFAVVAKGERCIL
jgi:hypothetical protein